MEGKRPGTQAPRILAWSLFGWSAVAAWAAVVLGSRIGWPLDRVLTEPLGPLAFSLVGALVASRHPRNAVGWTFSAVGTVYELHFVTQTGMPRGGAPWGMGMRSLRSIRGRRSICGTVIPMSEVRAVGTPAGSLDQRARGVPGRSS